MNDLSELHLGVFVAAFAVYAVFIAVASSFLLSWLGGWNALAKRFRTKQAFPTHRRVMQRGQFRRLVSYSIMTIGSDTEGIYLSVFLITHLGHPHLFVPWAEIEVEAPKRSLFSNLQTLHLGPERIPLRLRAALVEFLLEAKSAAAPAIDEAPTTTNE
jgi:hypothetical protein